MGKTGQFWAGNNIIVSLKPNRIFLFDRNANKIDTIFTDDTRDYLNLQVMDVTNKLFIVGDSLCLENSDRSDLTKWEIGKWDYGVPVFYNVLSKGNITLADMSDAVRPRNYYKIKLKSNSVSSAHDKIEVIQNNHFYAANPMPIPASNVVKANLYWDADYNPSNALKFICDIYGNKINEKADLTITNIQPYCATLVWNCSKAANGIYFMAIQYIDKTITVPVIVLR